VYVKVLPAVVILVIYGTLLSGAVSVVAGTIVNIAELSVTDVGTVE
jgi:hypothetical protein